MRIKHIAPLLTIIAVLLACDDNTGSLGIDMLPENDYIEVFTKSFDVTTESILVDSVYARTSTGYVGRFTDPDFGAYEASFMTQLNCVNDFRFPSVYKYDPINGKASGIMAGDSCTKIRIAVYYNSWFGDSLNVCRMSAYELNKRMDLNHNTNIVPEDYYDPNNAASLIGRRSFSAYDTSVSEEERAETDDNGNKLYYPVVIFPLSKERGNEILRESREHPEKFKDSDAFIDNIFKGIYLKSDLGDGTVINVQRVDIQMQFRFHAVDSLGFALKCADGTDSLYYSMETVFASTKEVLQSNRFANSQKIKEKASERNCTYLKSPAGIFTQATLPIDELNNIIGNDTLNAVKLSFNSYHQEHQTTFEMSQPQKILLIRKTKMKDFFENNQVNDNIQSFIASLTNNEYVFSNIARLVSKCVEEKKYAMEEAKKEAGSAFNEKTWEKQWMEKNPDWNKIVLVPVSVSYGASSESQSTITAVEHDLSPSYCKLKGGPDGDKLQIEVTYTRFK